MRTFVISDVHGCNDAFRRALKFIRLKKTDTLILLGDLIDRGADSKGVLDTVLLLIEHGFKVVCLKGNHEQMFIDALYSIQSKVNWLKNGGDMTLSSFYTSSIDKIPSLYIDLIQSFQLFYKTDDFIFVHAGLNMNLENPFMDEYSMLWMRDQESNLNETWLANRILVHGHNPTTYDQIRDSVSQRKKIICIDNGAFIRREGYGNICVLELEKLICNFISVTNEGTGAY